MKKSYVIWPIISVLIVTGTGCEKRYGPYYGSAAPVPTPTLQRSHQINFSGKCVAIKDGDTIEVMHNGIAERIRLYGIDCPEKGQPFGKAAKHFTSQMAFDKYVEVSVKDTDDYGRTVAVVLYKNISLNEELVRNGLAWWYDKYASDDLVLRELQNYAKSKSVGLWRDAQCVEPWRWRKGYKVP